MASTKRAKAKENGVAHVRNSESSRSLLAERRVAEALRRRGWKVAHGAYYTDPVTGKSRELDVTASRSWTKATRRTELGAALHLLVECKSMRGNQLLFAPRTDPDFGDRCYYFWPGLDDDPLRERIRALLAEAQMPAPAVERVMIKLEQLAYPRGKALIFDLVADAPAAPQRATAYRESRGAEARELRDDEASVLWRAIQTVFGAVTGIAQSLLEGTMQQLRDDLTIASRWGDDMSEYALEVLDGVISTVVLFHPVVVTDARLFTLEGEEPVEIPWCRVDQERIATYEHRWIDVVNSAAFDEYAEAVTKWYTRAMQKKKAEPRKR